MMPKTLDQEISAVCRHTDIGLWNAYGISTRGSKISGSGVSHLIFPDYRDNGLRVSEQEARFAFVEALCQGTLRYSVEAPTKKRHKFKAGGTTSRSAQTDLQVRSASKIGGICNVEFKAKGVSQSRKNSDRYIIYKDVKKLLCERVWGLWFHLLESVDNSTINKFLKVMEQQIGEVQRKRGKDVVAPGLTIHVCVLQHGFSLQKDVPLPINASELSRHLSVGVHVSGAELKEVRDLNGWDLFKRWDERISTTRGTRGGSTEKSMTGEDLGD